MNKSPATDERLMRNGPADRLLRWRPLFGIILAVLMVGTLAANLALSSAVEKLMWQLNEKKAATMNFDALILSMAKFHALIVLPAVLLAKWTFFAYYFWALHAFLKEAASRFYVFVNLMAVGQFFSLAHQITELFVLLVTDFQGVRSAADLHPPLGLDLLFHSAGPGINAALNVVNPFRLAEGLFYWHKLRHIAAFTGRQSLYAVVGYFAIIILFKVVMALI